MQEQGRTRYRHANPLAPQPVVAIELALTETEPAGLAAGAIALLRAALPPGWRNEMRMGGRTVELDAALAGEQGRFLAIALLLHILQGEGGCRAGTWGVWPVAARRAIAYAGWDDWAVADLATAEVRALLPALSGADSALATALQAARTRLRAARLDQTTAALVAAAERQSIPWRRVGAGDSLLQLGWGAKQRLLRESLIGAVQALPFLLARDKPGTSARLQQLGLPVPAHETAATADAAVAAATRLGGRVVVKPTGGSKARGVTADLRHEKAVRRAFELARRHGPVMVERHIEGNDHRLLVVGGRLVAAALRVPGGVVGDGRRSVAALVAEANRDPRRGPGFEKLLNLIEIDAEARELLARQKLSLDSVPRARQWVPLRRVGNISQGGIALDVTDRVHPDNAAAAVAAVEALGLPLAGVDFISTDIAKSYWENGAAICEVNGCPGLRPHWVGDPRRDVVTPILRLGYGEAEDGRIPLAAVTGTHGKTTTARMLAAILGAEGPGVGLATTDGTQLDGRWLARGDSAGVNGADLLLAHPGTRAAVLETARGGILRRGFAFDRCDVAAVTCVGDDHLGEHGVRTPEEMATVKGRLVALARGAVVLNLADPLVRAMAGRRSEGARLIWVAPPAATPEPADLPAGERVEVGPGETGEPWILHRDGARATPLVAVAALPAAQDGEGALPQNLENACFAAAMALGLGLAPATIARGLAGFRLGPAESLGRFQVSEAAGRTVLLDFAHNPRQLAAIAALLQRRWPGRRRLCAFTAPGNREDGLYGAAARAIAGSAELFVPYERLDWRRGRPEGWIAGALGAGLAEAGVPAAAVRPATTQEAAIDRLFALSRPGDLLLCLGAEPHAADARIVQALAALGRAASPDAAVPESELVR